MKNLILSGFIVFSLFHISKSMAQSTVDFSASKSSGCGALSAVQFTDLSTGTISSWSWNFGNGNTSTLQNPSASYASPGKYTVSLTVSGPNGNISETKTDFIVVYKNPSSNFSLSPTSGCSPLKVVFTDNSTLGDTSIKKYIWDFGDGSPENNQQSPTYTYPSHGNYDVSLQLIDEHGCTDTKVHSSVNVEQKPLALFSTLKSPINCAVPFKVDFVNYSTGTGTLSYQWDFGDGSTSTLKDPSHTYTSMGKYDVQLISSSSLCSDTIRLVDFVAIEPISAKFAMPDSICLGDTLFPSDSSTGAANLMWDFGDGSKSSSKTPMKIYADSGMHVIKLTASSGSACIANYTDSVYVQQVVAKYSLLEDTACQQPSTFSFINESTNADTLIWSFNKTTLNLPQLDFDFYGDDAYYDSLIAVSTLGCMDTFKPNFARYLFIPNFYILPDSGLFGCVPARKEFSYGNYFPFGPGVEQSWIKTSTADTFYTASAQMDFANTGVDTIILNVKNTLGCITHDTVYVYLGEELILDPISLPDTICAVDSIFFPHPTFNENLDSSGTHTLRFFAIFETPNATLPDSSEYHIDTNGIAEIHKWPDTGWVKVQHLVNYNGCISKSKWDSLYIKGPIASFYASIVDCNGPPIFDFHSNMVGVSKFYWDFGDGSPIDSINPNPTHSYDTNKYYTVTLRVYNEDSSCEDSISLTISTSPPPVASIKILGTRFCAYDDVILMENISGDFTHLQWIYGDTVIYDSSSIKISSTHTDTINVMLVAYGDYGCIDSAVQAVEFYKPTADFATDYIGGCLPLNVTFYDSTKSSLALKKRYWSINPFGMDSLNKNPSIYIDKSMLISASLIVEDYLGCRDTIRKDSLITIKKNELVFWGTDRKICVGESVTFENFSKIEDSTYVWIFGDGDSTQSYHTKHLYDSAGLFDVTLKYLDNQGCVNLLHRKDYISVENYPKADFTADSTQSDCYPLPVTFTDLSSNEVIDSWYWEFGDGVSSVFQHPFHNYTSPGNFDVSLNVSTANGCKDTVFKPQYIQTSGPTADVIISPDTVCPDEVVNFEMVNPKNVENFQWDFGDGTVSSNNPTSHTYQKTSKVYVNLIIADSGNVCTVSLTDSVYVIPLKADFEISNNSLCLGESIQFNNLSIGSNQFNWDFGDGSTSSQKNPLHLYSSAGSYEISLSIQNNNDCRDTLRKIITINPLPNIEIIPDTHLCVGDSIQLYSSGGISYKWSPSDFLSDDEIPNPIAFPDKDMEYQVLLSNQYNCVDSAKVSIYVAHPPKSNLLKYKKLFIGEEFLIENIDNGSSYIYTWTPTEGLSCSDCPFPLALPLKSGMYHLSIQDEYGCFSIMDSIYFEILEVFSLNVPSAFTPNGDGSNELVFVKGWGIKDLLEFKIYNRWGELIFDTSDINHGWDGTYNGKPQPMDTYVFTARGLTFKGNILSKKGNISLIR